MYNNDIISEGEFPKLLSKESFFIMDSVIDVVSNKVFLRMRNKTQLFSCLSDDHYHTRMMHSLEVAEITRKICEKLSDALKDKGVEINPEKAYIGALLHDVGHTPFGHAGERTLHEILKGDSDCFGRLKIVKEYKLEQGFKHNVNSGYLYVSKFQKNADEIILDCIVKHTKLAYSDDKELDYGLKLIKSRLVGIDYDINNKDPMYLESYIVANADEIAQVYSDYLDCCENGIGIDEFKNTLIYKGISGSTPKNAAKKAREELIDCFVKSLSTNEYRFPLGKGSEFCKRIEDFSKTREKVFKKSSIGLFDHNKKAIVETLFAFYYEHPENIEDKEKARIANLIKNNSSIKNRLLKKSLNFKDNQVKPIQFCKFIDNVKKQFADLEEGVEKESLKSILKEYLRGIAVYISMMTDNYAEHLCKKIVSCSAGKLF